MDRFTLARIQVLVNRVFRCRPCGETQGKDRVYFRFALRPNGIHIGTGTPDVLATPYDGVAFTSGQFLSVLVALRSCRNNGDGQLIHAVATLYCGETVVVNAVSSDILSVPDEHLTLRPFFGLAEVVRLRLVEVDTLNTIATGSQRDGVEDNRRRGISLAFPFGLAAEGDRTYRTLYRYHGQRQFIDTIFTRMCLIFNAIGVCSRDAAEAG